MKEKQNRFEPYNLYGNQDARVYQSYFNHCGI